MSTRTENAKTVVVFISKGLYLRRESRGPVQVFLKYSWSELGLRIVQVELRLVGSSWVGFSRLGDGRRLHTYSYLLTSKFDG